MRHPYFRDLREAEKRQKAMLTPDSVPMTRESDGLNAMGHSASQVSGSNSGKQPRYLNAGDEGGSEDEDGGHRTARQSNGVAGLPSISKNGGEDMIRGHGQASMEDGNLPAINKAASVQRKSGYYEPQQGYKSGSSTASKQQHGQVKRVQSIKYANAKGVSSAVPKANTIGGSVVQAASKSVTSKYK